MRAILLGLLFVLAATPAWATTTCHTFNGYTYCRDDKTGKTLVCHTFNKQTICKEKGN